MKNLINLVKTLKAQGLSLATAESCTSGYLSYLLTKIPGSSKIFKAGLIVYSLESKHKLFKIPLLSLKKSQGVSKEIASILAKKVRKMFVTDIGASIVGFAGPDNHKATGTIYLGICDKKGTLVTKAIIKGTRDTIRKKASNLLIDLLYKRISKQLQIEN